MRISFSISRRKATSSPSHSEIATPSAPARAAPCAASPAAVRIRARSPAEHPRKEWAAAPTLRRSPTALAPTRRSSANGPPAARSTTSCSVRVPVADAGSRDKVRRHACAALRLPKIFFGALLLALAFLPQRMQHSLQCFFIVGQVGQEILFGGHTCLDAAVETLLLTR